MKKVTYIFILLLSFITLSCSDKDDDNVNKATYRISFSFEGSQGSNGLVYFKTLSNDDIVDEIEYEDLSNEDFTLINKFEVESSELISGIINIEDSTQFLRGYATVEIIDENDEVVASLEREYMHTDKSSNSSEIKVTYNILTSDSFIESNVW